MMNVVKRGIVFGKVASPIWLGEAVEIKCSDVGREGFKGYVGFVINFSNFSWISKMKSIGYHYPYM